MLSMNSSTSDDLPASAPSSRKYSAVVRAAVVDQVAEQVEHPAQRLLADRDGDRSAGVDHVHAPAEAVGGPEGDGPDLAAADVAGHLAGQADRRAVVLGVDLDGVVNL